MRRRRARSSASTPPLTAVQTISHAASCFSRIRRFTSLSSTISTRSPCWRPRRRYRERVGDGAEHGGEAERAALVRPALDPDAAVHHADQRRADRQARARCRRSGAWSSRRPDGTLRKSPSDARARCRCPCRSTEKRSAVSSSWLGLGRDGDEHVPALGELDGVADQVHDDLTQPQRVAVDRRRHARVDVDDQLEPLLIGAHGQRTQRLVDRLEQRERRPTRASAGATRSSRSRGCR